MLSFRIAAVIALVAASSVAAINCAAGSFVTTNKKGKLACKVCPKGTFNPSATAATTCTPCNPGTFTSDTGSKACCACCQGYYQDTAGATKCKACTRAKGGLFSPVGASSSSSCGNFVPGSTGSDNSCVMDGDTCPAVTAAGAQGSAVKRRRDLGCARGFNKCQCLTNPAGFDCIDVAKDLESCGGCMLDANPLKAGQDCTAIPGVSIVECKRGRCLIVACRKGLLLSEDGKSCESPKMHIQEHSL